MRRTWPVVPVVFLLFTVPWLFFSPDDLFIHLRFAQNLATLGEWSFNPGDPVAGATSPPWVLTLALLRSLGIEPVLSAKGLGLVVGLLTLGAVYWALTEARVPTKFVVLITAAVGASHWLTLWTASGMETPLPVLLLTLAVALMLREKRNAWLIGAVLGLATLARPDAIPASIVLLVGAFVVMPRIDGLKALGSFAVVAISWPLVSWFWLGTWLPITVGAKSGSILVASIVPKAILRTGMVAALEMLPLALLFAIGIFLDREIRRRWKLWLFPLVAAASYPAGYLVNHIQGGIEATGRYLVPWYVLLAVASGIALVPWMTNGGKRRWVTLVVCLCLLQSGLVAISHLSAVQRYHEYHEETLLAAGNWLRENEGPSTVVAAGDIGVLGFVGNVHVLDLVGIVNPEASSWAAEGRTYEAMREQQPDYFINSKWDAPLDQSQFDEAELDRHTRDVIFEHTHRDYRWTLDPGWFEVTFREMDW